ncbi:MAG: hypothetical protein Q9227_004488 [Pyrenula ochraceoflavens]
METVDGSEHYERSIEETSPSLLTVILDTNPAAWDLFSETLPFHKAVSDLLIFLNAHIASNYTNKVAVLASHCNSATWLYPAPRKTGPSGESSTQKRAHNSGHGGRESDIVEPTKRLRLNPPKDGAMNGSRTSESSQDQNGAQQDESGEHQSSGKYQPFRLVEQELIANLRALIQSTNPTDVSRTNSTMIAGALTLALSYINREMISYAEARGGPRAATAEAIQTSTTTTDRSALQSRILLVSLSPSSDLANQYIAIMNAIFACQRLSIPIDICQFSLPGSTSTSTVFLQQACDATRGIYIPVSAPQAFLQYLLMAFLPGQASRRELILPTRIDVDFRAACFCHRKVVDVGFVCSICLSIFCSVPENGDCLTCGTHLHLGKELGGKPIVVARKKAKKGGKKNRDRMAAAAALGDSPASASTPGPS